MSRSSIVLVVVVVVVVVLVVVLYTVQLHSIYNTTY